MVTKESQITLKEGFIERAAGMEDLETVVALLNVCSLARIGVAEHTVKDTEKEWTTPGMDIARDTRMVFSPDETLAAYMEIWTNDDPLIRFWVWGRVHPDFESQGIGSYLMAWAEARARQELGRAPANARVVLESGALSSYPPSVELLKGFDMQHVRSFYEMQIEMDERPPQPEWAEGITVRTYRHPEEAEAVYRAQEEAFRDHFGYVEEPFESGFTRFMHHRTKAEDFDPGLWFLAMDGDEIAGMSICREASHSDKESGWVSILGVRKPWRKRGIGLALLQHSFRAFWERGKRKGGLGVDAENLTGALRLYEKAGMRVHRQFDLYEKEIRAGEEMRKM